MSSVSALSSAPKFLAFVPDEESLLVLQRFAQDQGLPDGCIHMGTADDAAEYLTDHPTPEFLLVDVPSAEDAPDALDKLADVCAPGVRVLVTSTVDEYSFFRWLTEIGVHHYLLKPLTEENLRRAIQHPAAEGQAADTAADKPGKLIAVMGARGGVGTSAVAINLAAAIGELHHEHTALLDADPQWGTVSLMMDLEPGRGLRDALSKPDRVDSLFMERVMLKYSDHVSILSSEEPMDEPIQHEHGAAEALLGELRKKYPIVVVDMPRDVGEFGSDILREADHVLIICELTLLSLRDTMRLHDYCKEKLEKKRIHIIANRQGMLNKYEMHKAEFERSLGQKLYGVIPFDLEAYGQMASGELPVTAKVQTPMTQALKAIADMLHKPSSAAPLPARKTRVMAWLTGKK